MYPPHLFLGEIIVIKITIFFFTTDIVIFIPNTFLVQIKAMQKFLFPIREFSFTSSYETLYSLLYPITQILSVGSSSHSLSSKLSNVQWYYYSCMHGFSLRLHPGDSRPKELNLLVLFTPHCVTGIYQFSIVIM